MKKFICIFCVIFFALSNTISFASNELDNLYENIDVNSMWYKNYFGNANEDGRLYVKEENITEEMLETDNNKEIDDTALYSANDSNEFSGWKSCGTMTSARSYMSSVAVGDNIYTFGGKESGVVTNKTEYYNTSNEIWYRKAPMPVGRYKHTAVLYDNKVYICGGYDENGLGIDYIDVYDVIENKWENSIETPNNNVSYAAGIYDGELYIFGGKANGELSKKIYKYNFNNQEWTDMGSEQYLGVDNIVIPNSKGFRIINDWNIYEYDTFRLVKIDSVPRHIYDYTAIGIDNFMYIIGGRDSKNSGESITNVKYRDDCDTSNLVSDWVPEWFNDLRLIRGLACHNAVVTNNNIYVFGGQTTYGEDQKLMFKRSLDDAKDDYPDDKVYPWTRYVYGSINGDGDQDRFVFKPSESGLYQIRFLGAIHSNNKTPGRYGFNISIDEKNWGTLIGGYYPIEFGAVYMEKDKEYTITIFDIEGVFAGNYMYEIVEVYDDLPNSIEDAVEINIEEDINKSFISYKDVDCVKFDVPFSGEYDFTVEMHMNGEDWEKTVPKGTLYNNEKKEIYVLSGHDRCKLDKGTYYLALQPDNHYYYHMTSSQYTLNIHNVSKYDNMYTPRIRHQSVNDGENMYILSGLSDTFSKSDNIDKYNKQTYLWGLPLNKCNANKDVSAALVNNKIYLFGGYDDSKYYNAVEYYDLKENTLKSLDSKGYLHTERGRATSIVHNDKVYIIGGRNSSGYVDDIEVFDSSNNSVDSIINLPEPMVDVQAFFNNEILYIVGGITEDGYSDSVYAYQDGEWIQKSSMPYVSEYMRGKEYNGDFFCGAVNSDGNVDILKYDTKQNKWSVWEKNFINGLIYYGFDIMDGKIYVTGGYEPIKDVVTDKVYICDCITEINNTSLDIPIRNIGFEYEQNILSETVKTPEILGVKAKVIDKTQGIYELSVDEGLYNSDQRSVPVFFWSSREGMFRALSDNYSKVKFYADPNTGDRKVKVIVGIGDGRGYVDRKAILLDGNNATGGQN